MRKNHPLDAVFRSPPDGLEVSGNRGPRIDDPGANHVGIRAVESEGGRVRSSQADNALWKRHAGGSTGVFSPKLGSQSNTGDSARELRLFAFALAAMVVVAIADTAIGSRAVLAELLVAGPLIAATGASPRQTLITAVIAAVVVIPIGLVSDAFLSTTHVMAIALVAVGGTLAVIIARLRAKRERDSDRLQVQVGVARVIAEADSFEEAAPKLLAAIARPMGRELALYWRKEEDDKLHCVVHWREEGFDFDAFERASRERPLASGEGLAGEVWKTGRPMWLGEARSSSIRFVEAG